MVSPIPSDLKHILKAYDLSSSEKTSGHISIKKGHHWYHWCAKFLNLRGNLPTIVICDREKDAEEGGQNGSQWGESNSCLPTSWGTWVCSQLGFLTLWTVPDAWVDIFAMEPLGAPQVLPPQDARGFGAPTWQWDCDHDRNRAAYVGLHGWIRVCRILPGHFRRIGGW